MNLASSADCIKNVPSARKRNSQTSLCKAQQEFQRREISSESWIYVPTYNLILHEISSVRELSKNE